MNVLYQFAVNSKASNKHSVHMYIFDQSIKTSTIAFEKNEFLRNI